MEYSFPMGTRRLHDDANFSFQLNRLAVMGGGDADEIAAAAARIRGIDDWTREFLALGEKAEAGERLLAASAYFRAADFFLPFGDTRKTPAFERAAALFRRHAAADFEEGLIIEHKIPYESGFLPAWRLPAPEGGPASGVIVLHGGFDSAKEELYPAADLARKSGHEVILFEGPGQGEVLALQGMAMTHEWERPVKAVLDAFNLSGVTLVGLSLGGFLAPRAAAFEKRIARVVAWDVLHDFFHVLASARGPLMGAGISVLSALRADRVLNALALRKAALDPLTAWGLDRGMGVFGEKTPAAMFRAAKRYRGGKTAGMISQDVLLLAGAEDHLIPLSMFHADMKAMKNARSLTGRVFTRAENAADHCQIGNLPLALSTIDAWICERSESLREKSP